MQPRLLSLAAALSLLIACASEVPPPVADPTPPVPTEQRIEELLVEIRRDRHRVIELLAEPADPDAPMRENPEIQELARRLPQLQDELRALGAQHRLLEAETLLPDLAPAPSETEPDAEATPPEEQP